jgi:hypothetical protein
MKADPLAVRAQLLEKIYQTNQMLNANREKVVNKVRDLLGKPS